MAEEKKILVDIEINSEDIKKANESMASSAKSAAVLTLELNKLKEEQKANSQAAKDGTISANELAARQAGLKLKMTETSKALAASNKEYANNKTVVDAAKGSNEQLRARLALQTKEYNGLSKSQRENTKEGRQMEANIKALTDKLKANEKAVGDNRRNVGNYEDALNKLPGPIGGFISGLKGMATAAKAFVATPLGAALTAISLVLSPLIVFFTKTKRGAELLAQASAGLSATVSVLTDRVSMLGESLIKVFSGDFAGAAEDAKGAFSGIADEIGKESEAALKLEKRMQALRDAERELLVETSKRKAEVAELQLIAEDETNSMKERAEAIKKANAIQEENMASELALQQERVAIIEQQLALGENLEEDEQKLAEERARLGDIEAANIKKLRTLKAKENSIRNQEHAQQVKNANAIRKLTDDQIKAEQKEAEVNAKIREDFRVSQLTDLEQRKEDAINKANELREAGEEEKAIQSFLSQELIEIHREEQDIILNDRLKAFEDEANAAKLKIETEIESEETRKVAIMAINEELLLAKQQALDLEIMNYQASTDAIGVIDEVRNEKLLREKAEVDAQLVQIDRDKTEALKAHTKEVEDAQNKMLTDGLAAAQGGLSAVGNIIDQFGKTLQDNIKNIEEQGKAAGKTQAEINKQTRKARKEAHDLQVAAAIVQTLQSGIAAYQSGASVPVVGVALGPIMAAAALAFGFANVAKMKQEKPTFAKGGVLVGASHADGGIQLTGNGQHYGEAEGGEIVLTKGVNANPRLRAEASRLNVLGGGVALASSSYMADGGIVSPTFAARQTATTPSVTKADFADVINSMPNPVVQVTEINKVQGRVVTVSESANL